MDGAEDNENRRETGQPEGAALRFFGLDKIGGESGAKVEKE